MKSSQIISCPVCNKSKFHSRVGNCCSGCGYILEESDLQYGAVKYTSGVFAAGVGIRFGELNPNLILSNPITHTETYFP